MFRKRFLQATLCVERDRFNILLHPQIIEEVEEEEITDEVLDNIADTAINVIQDILKYFNV